jgi:nucleoside-diphosphate-sugar epimerase
MKLLRLSDSPTRPTGFGTVGRHLLRRLAATGEYQILALGRDYDPAAHDPTLYPYPLFPFGAHLAAQVDDVCRRQPDGIVTLGHPGEYGFLATSETHKPFP